jgi:hypothetical protein
MRRIVLNTKDGKCDNMDTESDADARTNVDKKE